MKAFFSRCLAALGLVLGLAVTALAAEGNTPADYQVKAAFLFNIIKFVEWPEVSFAGPEAPLVLLVLGDDPVARALDDLNGEHVGRRWLQVRRIDDLAAAGQGQILYLAGDQRPGDRATLARLPMRGVLTVADVEGFAREGGMVNFLLVNRRVRFEINQLSVQQAGMTVSSRLLTLAETVYPGALKPERVQ